MRELINMTKDINGIIRIDLINRAGDIIYTHTHHNMVCVSIKEALANVIMGDNISERAISQVAIGTDGNIRDNSITDFSQTDSANKFMKSLVPQSSTFPEPGVVEVNFSIDYTEPAGISMAVQEYGLFTGDGLLVARALKPVINKNSDVAIIGKWTLIFN